MVRWHERWFEAWDEFRANPDEIIEAQDIVVTGVTVHARAGKSGMEITDRFFHVFEFRNDKILRIREYLERDQALEAVGLRE